MIVVQYPQEKGAAEIPRKIIALENTAWPQTAETETFPSAPDTYVTSFVVMEKETAVCHVGVRKSVLLHKGQKYQAYGLSEVVTHPDYRNQGLATQTIEKAARYILDQHPDISIFTCERSRVSLYARGGWEAIKGACFVGGSKEKPFRSDSLGLVTMMMFLSPNGKRHRADFENMTLFLLWARISFGNFVCVLGASA